jgi:hypothetical protein
MKLWWLGVAILAAGLGIGCSQGSESPSPRPGLDTLRAGLGERDELERLYLLTSFLRTLGPEDVLPALAEVEKHRVGFDKEEVRLLMLAWTRFDGPGAFATARDWPTPWRSILMEQAMHAWGFNDGWAALAECEQIEDEELQKSLRAALVSGWVSSGDRQGATEFAATVSNARQRTRLAFRLAGQAKRDGPDAVIAWADAVPEDAPNEFKDAVFATAAGAIARLDPERAAPWYESQMQHWYTASGLLNIAGKWAQFHDPKTLIAWIETLPIEEDRESERTDAVRVAFRTWAPEAPGEVEAWLQTASGGPIRDAAIDELARATADASPAEALRWAGQIEDEKLRRKRTFRYSRRWFVQDPEAAAAWLEEADISDGVRQEILNNSPHAQRWANRKNAERDE